jgi:hypothetical protein
MIARKMCCRSMVGQAEQDPAGRRVPVGLGARHVGHEQHLAPGPSRAAVSNVDVAQAQSEARRAEHGDPLRNQFTV